MEHASVPDVLRQEALMAVSGTYCVLPFIQLSVGSGGRLKNCCISQGDHSKSSGEYWNVGHDNLDEIWKSEFYENLRAQFLRGEKPEACRRCFDDESIGIESKRFRDNRSWKEYYGLSQALPVPIHLDLRLGNLCNLKCRICSPHSSSKFAREFSELFSGFNLEAEQRQFKWAEDRNGPFWQTLEQWIGSVDRFDIYGGEPFMSRPHFEILERSKALGFSKRQTLHYNTNGTHFPEKIANEVWPHFKSVNIMFSVDGVGKQFEYQRHPAVWEQVEENIQKFKKYRKLNLSICYTVSFMNVWNIPEFQAWTRKMKLPYRINYLHNPQHFIAQIFSGPAKRLIEMRLRKFAKDREFKLQIEPLIGFLWHRTFSTLEREHALRQIDIYDRKRGEKFHEVFPETYTLMNMTDETMSDAHPGF